MSLSLKPIFNRKNRRNKSGLYSVHIRVTIHRKSHYLPIQNFPKLKKSHWDHKKSLVAITHPQALQLNKIISLHISKLEKYWFNCLEKNRQITWIGIQAFMNVHNENINFLDFCRNFNIRRKDISAGTHTIYNTTIKHLANYSSEISLQQINRYFVEQFVQHLKNEGYEQNTINKYVTRFGLLYRAACKDADMVPDHDLFKDLGISRQKSRRETLTIEELHTIEHLKLTNLELDHSRHIFIFQCHTGCYYSDVALLTIDNIIISNGKQFLMYNRSKNGNECIVHLDDKAKEVISRFGNTNGQLFTNLVAEDRYNKRLKLIVQHAGINKVVTNKVARHTFADHKTSAGMPRVYLAKMLGHKKEETTQTYYDMSNDIFLENIQAFI